MLSCKNKREREREREKGDKEKKTKKVQRLAKVLRRRLTAHEIGAKSVSRAARRLRVRLSVCFFWGPIDVDPTVFDRDESIVLKTA